MTLLKQRGFNLIELMIVVAIIGILAAIAIPQYQRYQSRTQISEAISLLAPVKTVLAELPSATSAQLAAAIPGLDLYNSGYVRNDPGKYISRISFDNAVGGSAVATVTFRNNTTTALANKDLYITVNGGVSAGVSGAMTCAAPAIDSTLFPSACA